MKKGSPMERNFGVSPVKNKPGTRKKTTTKEKAKAVVGTITDTFVANEPLTAISNISKTYKKNKAYQRALSAKKK